MKVIAKKNRELALINAQNTQNENRAETITLVVPEEYEDYNKKIVFVTDDGTVWDVITNNEYKITNAITKYDKVDFYIWLTKEVDGESIDFRTKTKTLNFYHNEDASDEITDEEIHGVNTVVNLLEEEIEKVENLNIEATKIGSTTTVTITKKDGTTESVEINDGVDGQDGRDGQDGYTPQKGVDYFTEHDIEEIETNVKNDIEESVLVNYSLIAETGAKIELSINQTNYKLTAILKDKNNNIIHTSNVIDLPLETMVVNATYDNINKAIILTLQNGTTVSISVADLVSGLVSESQLQTILANYYTKTEINNLLANKVDKVAGKGLSTNDFTDEYKEQVDTNTEDIEDIQDEQTEQNTEIEKLQTKNARFKATLPTTTGEGETITLDKTAEMEFIKPPLPMGNSEQNGEPAPDNEVPIINVTGDVEVVVEDKNIINITNEVNVTNQGVVITGDEEKQVIKFKGTISNTYCQSDILPLKKPISTGIFRANFKSTCDAFIVLVGENTTWLKNMQSSASSSIVVDISTLSEPVVALKFGIEHFTSGANVDYEVGYQLTKGSELSSYVPHKEQTFTFPLGNEKLMLGDYLADDGIHKNRKKIVLDGTSENKFSSFSTGANNRGAITAFSDIKKGVDFGYNTALCTNFAYVPNVYFDSGDTEGFIVDSTGTIYVRFGSQSEINTLAKANQWLANTLPELEYELAEETIIPYTPAQQTAYNQIKQALSYEEQTNISSNTIALFNVEAYQSTKLVLEEMATAIVALGGV